MSQRKVALWVASLVLFTMILGGCAASTGSTGKTSVVLAVGGKSCICYLPTTLAHEMGYFEEQGLEIDLQDFKGGSKALAALNGGSADVVSGYYEHTIKMQAKDKHISSFVNFADVPGLVLAVSKQASGEINSIKDLKGKKVGVSSPGSATHAFANYLLSQEGLKPEDIAVVGVGIGTTSVASVENGEVDAAVLLDPAVTLLQNRDQIKILVDTRTREDTQRVFGGAYPAGSLYTTKGFLQENPETAQKLVNAMVKSLKFIKSHSAEEIADKMPEEYYGGNKDLYIQAMEAALPGFREDGLMPKEGPESVFKVLVLSNEAVQEAKDSIELVETYTDQFTTSAE